MLVISDTSPISNLYKIGELALLPQIFQQIILPKTVYGELLALEQKGYDLTVLKEADWITIVTAQNTTLVSAFCQFLDRGEAEAIVLAQELKADVLLMDEAKGGLLPKSMTSQYWDYWASY